MEIKLRAPNNSLSELIITDDNTQITKDIAIFSKEKERWIADPNVAEMLITSAMKIFRHNGQSDVDSCLEICGTWLSDSERKSLIESLQEFDLKND